nr:DUF2946 family protein [Sphingomonas sp. CROZ-RG-20F-R02-07]
MVICAAALLLKLLVPTGYMIDSDGGRMGIIMCSGTGPMRDMPAMHGDGSDPRKSKDHGKAEMPCAFSSLSAAALSAIDPIQLDALIAFVMALGFVGFLLPDPLRCRRFRPPLRGPPAFL